MKKILLNILITLPILISSQSSVACSGGISMSVPHIHDENGLLVSIENAKGGELKQLNIYQLFEDKPVGGHN